MLRGRDDPAVLSVNCSRRCETCAPDGTSRPVESLLVFREPFERETRECVPDGP